MLSNHLLGRTSPFVNANDLSLRLIAFVASHLVDNEETPTQVSIGSVLNVSQPFVHAVLYKGKSFGEDKFDELAQTLEIDLDDLVAKLLSIDLEKSWLSQLKKVRSSPMNIAAAVFDSYETLHLKLEDERRVTRHPQAGRAFDSYKAYSEVLAFLWRSLALLEEAALCVGVLTQEGRRSRAIWVNDTVVGEHEVTRSLDDDHLLKWLLKQFCHARDPSQNDGSRVLRVSVPIAELPEAVVQNSQLLTGASDSVTISLRNVYSDMSPQGSSTNVSIVVLSDGILSDEVPERAMAMSCGCHLVDKVVSYAIEDNLRCIEVMMDSRLKFGEFLGGECENSYLELAELYVEQLFNAVLAKSTFSDLVATMDLWVYYLSEKTFVSPSEKFRRVNPKNEDETVWDNDEHFSLRLAFEREFELGRLEPRPLGKTRHMIAHQRALVMNKRDNCLGSKAWSSSHVLELGTFVGIPFIFRPLGEGTCFLSALYVRFMEDLLPKDASRAIEEIVWIMRDEELGERFAPLMRLNRVAKSKRPRFAWREFRDRDRGVWYEVGNKRDIDNIDKSASAINDSKRQFVVST